MRCLSVRQPWAQLIAQGRKTIELRTWATRYRGPIVIVAGKARGGPRAADWRDVDGPRGAAIAIAELVDCRPARRSDARAACTAPEDGEWAWVLRDVQPIAPVPQRGRLGLYRVPEDLARDLGVAA